MRVGGLFLIIAWFLDFRLIIRVLLRCVVGNRSVQCLFVGIVGRVIEGGIVSRRFVLKTERLGLVPTTPVVLGFACTPFALELTLALVDDAGVVEVPRLVGLSDHGGVFGLCQRIDLLALLLFVGGTRSLLFRLFLLLYQLLDKVVDDGIQLLLRQLGELQQTVLQLDGFGMRLQFVQDGGQSLDLLVILVVVLDNAHGHGVGFLGADVVGTVEGEFAQGKGCRSFLCPVSGTLLQRHFVTGNGFSCISFHQRHFGKGGIYLIQIILVSCLAAQIV